MNEALADCSSSRIGGSDLCLPGNFCELEVFREWILPTLRDRMKKRCSSSMEEIKRFYDAMISRMPEILEHLGKVPARGEIEKCEKNLMLLALSLAEVGPAVEWYNQPAVIDGMAIDKFAILNEIAS